MEKQSKFPPAGPAQKGERIAKRLARAGLCSRRDAERWIAAGRVAVDGQVISSPALNVTDKSRILVDDKPLAAAEPTRLWRYHKPDGVVTTHRDPEGRPTLFDSLPKDLPRVISIGRLDLTSEGLILLTNDGDLARRLELPATGWLRRYRVRVYGEATDEKLARLVQGVEVDGTRLKADAATFDRATGANAWITLSLREGRNREVRKLCEAIGLKVTRLIRVSYGPFQLGNLKRGDLDEVAPKVLRDQLGGPKVPSASAKRSAPSRKRPARRSAAKARPTARGQ